ncbi:hypothetical protein [Limisphaera sp. VF-2]|uniref:hypothetical protein n=1 Tax=Limisphaera sp. VF-2 TaxID=3400418 RepID=UPI001766268D|nr:hypothetical protein [Limisphaera sp.]
MDRQVEALRQRLMRAARACPPSASVPPGFEARVVAALRQGAPSVDPIRGWIQGLMRAAWACAGLSLLLTLWLWMVPMGEGAGEAAADLESTLLAAVEDSEWTW